MRAHRSLWMILIGFVLASTASAAPIWQVTKIADGKTTIPGQSGRFTSFGQYPAVSGANVVFKASGTGLSGVYGYIAGSLVRIADTTTLPPGGSSAFYAFDDPSSIRNGAIVFTGQWSGGSGVFRWANGAVSRVADNTTAVPGDTGTFKYLPNYPSIDGNNVAFTANYGTWSSTNGWSKTGIFAQINGTLQKIVDKTTILPGSGGQMNAGFNPNIDGDRIAFEAIGMTGSGFYCYTDGALTTIVQRDMLAPGGGTFTGYYYMSAMRDGDVAFQGAATGTRNGIFTWIDGQLACVADTTMNAPGRAGNFDGFFQAAIDNGQTVFSGRDAANHYTLYSNFGGTLDKIIGYGDVLDGKTINSVRIGREALSDSMVAFQVTFSDNSTAVYMANVVPLPQAFWCALPLLAWQAMRRRRAMCK